MAPKKKETAEKPAAPAPAASEAPVAEVEEVDRFAAVLEKLNEFAAGLKEVITHVKNLQKEHAKLQKASTKKVKKASGGASTGPRTLSGFAKPSALSDELCEFMGVPKGAQMARTEVTRSINEYIKKHNLQDSNDKRHILPDAKLKKILNLGAGDKLTYFNLQKYMKHHFTKEA